MVYDGQAVELCRGRGGGQASDRADVDVGRHPYGEGASGACVGLMMVLTAGGDRKLLPERARWDIDAESQQDCLWITHLYL